MSYFDDNEDRIVYGRGRRVTRRETVRCAFCGTLCTWSDATGKWRMMHDGDFHVCHANPHGPATPDEFPSE